MCVAATAGSALAGGPSGGGDPCRVAWWPQPRQSSCSSSSSESTEAPTPATGSKLALAWTYESQGGLSTPVVADGIVYVQTIDAGRRPRLRALELSSGKEIWEAFGGDGDSPPVVDGDVLLRVTSHWRLRRYGPRNGNIAWARDVARPDTEGWTGLPVIADGNWYLSTGTTLLAVRERTGRPRWSDPLVCSRCGVAAAAERVYAAGGSAIAAFDARTGAKVWSTHLPTKTEPGSVILAGGRVFTVTLGPRSKIDGVPYYVDAYAAADGRHLWRTFVGSEDGYLMDSAPAATAQLVVYASPGGNVYALDASTGVVRWRHPFDATNSVPALANGLAWLVADKSASLVSLSLADGRQVSSTPLNESFEGLDDPSPVVAGGTVMLSTPHGRLLAYTVLP